MLQEGKAMSLVGATTRKCPYCAEEIQLEAKKCRYCGEWLEGAAIAASQGETTIENDDTSSFPLPLERPRIENRNRLTKTVTWTVLSFGGCLYYVYLAQLYLRTGIALLSLRDSGIVTGIDEETWKKMVTEQSFNVCVSAFGLAVLGSYLVCIALRKRRIAFYAFCLIVAYAYLFALGQQRGTAGAIAFGFAMRSVAITIELGIIALGFLAIPKRPVEGA